MRVWLFQDPRQKKKLGEEKCPWSVGWYDPEGKRKSKRVGSKSVAEKLQRKIEGQLAAGLYKQKSSICWSDFREEYKTKVLPKKRPKTRETINSALKHFERHCKPQRVSAINTRMIDDFIARRRLDPGKKVGSKVSIATINNNLRHLRAVLQKAYDWKYISELPKFDKEREAVNVGSVVSTEHFKLIYDACRKAEMPKSASCEPVAWWQALLVFAVTSGWRIGEILALAKTDFNLENGAVVTKSRDNKGNREERDYLPQVTIDHLSHLSDAPGPLVFYWPHHRRTLDSEFSKIQDSAGIHLACRIPEPHDCTAACHQYGFHSLRRSYATLNADQLPAPVLQQKMRHKSFQTTLRYIELSNKMKKTVEKVYVPDFLTRQEE